MIVYLCPDRIQINQKLNREKSRGILSQASTVKANNLDDSNLDVNNNNKIYLHYEIKKI